MKILLWIIIIVLSIAVCVLVYALQKSINNAGDYLYQLNFEVAKVHNLNKKIEYLNMKNEVLQDEVNAWKMTSAYQNQTDLPAGTLDAVRYAVKKSHPDNGGNAEDFIKFNEILKQLKKMED